MPLLLGMANKRILVSPLVGVGLKSTWMAAVMAALTADCPELIFEEIGFQNDESVKNFVSMEDWVSLERVRYVFYCC